MDEEGISMKPGKCTVEKEKEVDRKEQCRTFAFVFVFISTLCKLCKGRNKEGLKVQSKVHRKKRRDAKRTHYM